MKHNGTIDEKDKSKREYKKINTIKIDRRVLLSKEVDLKAEKYLYKDNTFLNFNNLLDKDFIKKIENKIDKDIFLYS
jgi:hypothetical protein